jgi:hypothetical protein
MKELFFLFFSFHSLLKKNKSGLYLYKVFIKVVFIYNKVFIIYKTLNY